MIAHRLMWLCLAIAACGPAGDAGSEAAADGRDAASSGESGREAAGAMPGMQAEREAVMGSGMMAMAGEPIRITARQASLAGVTFSVAREAPLERTVRAVASVAPNERGLGMVNARVMGWVEKLHVNETGRRVQAGQPLLELYAPDLVRAQEELLIAHRLLGRTGGDSLIAAARRRLKLWEISDDQVAELERTGVVRSTLTLRSAFRGHVVEKHVMEGQMVRPGDVLFRIADLSTVWIEPAIFEQDMPWVRVGQPAEVNFEALPGHVFEGRVTFIHPTLDARTRTLRVRIEVANRDFQIKPGMYGTVRIRAAGPAGVLVPLTAVLPTGERDLAFVVRGGGVVPTEVSVAQRGDAELLVTHGLAAGDTVIASATFLFDSESNLAAAMKGIMLNMGMGLDMGGMEMGDMEMGDVPTEGEGMPMPADTGGNSGEGRMPAMEERERR